MHHSLGGSRSPILNPKLNHYFRWWLQQHLRFETRLRRHRTILARHSTGRVLGKLAEVLNRVAPVFAIVGCVGCQGLRKYRRWRIVCCFHDKEFWVPFGQSCFWENSCMWFSSAHLCETKSLTRTMQRGFVGHIKKWFSKTQTNHQTNGWTHTTSKSRCLLGRKVYQAKASRTILRGQHDAENLFLNKNLPKTTLYGDPKVCRSTLAFVKSQSLGRNPFAESTIFSHQGPALKHWRGPHPTWDFWGGWIHHVLLGHSQQVYGDVTGYNGNVTNNVYVHLCIYIYTHIL